MLTDSIDRAVEGGKALHLFPSGANFVQPDRKAEIREIKKILEGKGRNVKISGN